MQCANCQTDGPPAYTLRAHVDDGGATDGSGADGSQTDGGQNPRTDGGASSTVDLRFCSLACLRAWT